MPLSDLPIEVIAHILLLAAESVYHNGHRTGRLVATYRGSSLRLREVCRRWQMALDSAPRFWAGLLPYAYDETGWNEILGRSGAVPLSVATTRVPLAAQANVLKRTRVLYVNRNDRHTNWNTELHRAGTLPLLRELALQRSCYPGGQTIPMLLDAPYLSDLSIDCDAEVTAPRLTYLKINAIYGRLPGLCQSIRTSLPNITSVEIKDNLSGHRSVWQHLLAALADSSVIELSIDVNPCETWPTKKNVVLPHLKSLATNIALPITAPKIERLHTTVFAAAVHTMLKGMPLVRHLWLGDCYGPIAFRTHAPSCTQLVLLLDITEGLGLFMESLEAPQLVRFHGAVEFNPIPEHAGIFELPRVGGELIRVRRQAQGLAYLRTFFNSVLEGPVSLTFNAMFDPGERCIQVALAAKDSRIDLSGGDGLVVSSSTEAPCQSCPYEQAYPTSSSLLLSAFALKNVDEIHVCCFPGVSNRSPLHDIPALDPFKVTNSFQASVMKRNLLDMPGVKKLIVTVTKHSLIYGSEILRVLADETELWPQLLMVEFYADESVLQGSDGRWRDDIMRLMGARAIDVKLDHTLSSDWEEFDILPLHL